MFETMRPILATMGKELYYLGGCGTGKSFKNLNNLLSVINTVVTSEACRIAEHEGLDLNLLYDIINASSGTSASFKGRFKRMTKGDYQGGFQLGLAREGFGQCPCAGQGAPLPMSRLAYELLLAAKAYDQEDMAAVYKLFLTAPKLKAAIFNSPAHLLRQRRAASILSETKGTGNAVSFFLIAAQINSKAEQRKYGQHRNAITARSPRLRCTRSAISQVLFIHIELPSLFRWHIAARTPPVFGKACAPLDEQVLFYTSTCTD